MRPLSESELPVVLDKLKKYLGENLPLLLDSPSTLLRLHKDRVFYLTEEILGKAQHIPRKQLILAGTLLGKFTHSKKFKLQITALPVLAKFGKNKIWLKSGNPVQSFLYGNHAVKAHLKKMTEGIGKNDGVVVYGDEDLPIGFGALARDGPEIKTMGVESIVVYHQADCGEYLRDERELI